MRCLRISFNVLAIVLSVSRAGAQTPQGLSRLDTLTITGGSAEKPMRVYLLNSGARVLLMPTGMAVMADTLVLRTPTTIRLPHERFALDIRTMLPADEASVTLSPGPDTLKAGRFTTTLFTPIRLVRDTTDAPLLLTAAKVMSTRVP